MSKRKRAQNIEKKLKEGRGSGIGEDYKPWIKIQDVPSKGRSTRVKGTKVKRQYELLSDMERDFFYLLEFSDDVVDIREQYPLLPREETMEIALELGVEHPKDPTSGEEIVMTTDFLITLKEGDSFYNVARTIKSKGDLLERRINEKFEIERRYWKKRDVDWSIVTECEINKIVANNISFFRGYKNLRNIDSFMELDSSQIQDLIYEFIKRIVDSERSIRNICAEFDKDMFLLKGSGISIFKYLVINKIVIIDIKEKININSNIKFDHIKEENIRKVESV
jgi:hypothetical protein